MHGCMQVRPRHRLLTSPLSVSAMQEQMTGVAQSSDSPVASGRLATQSDISVNLKGRRAEVSLLTRVLNPTGWQHVCYWPPEATLLHAQAQWLACRWPASRHEICRDSSLFTFVCSSTGQTIRSGTSSRCIVSTPRPGLPSESSPTLPDCMMHARTSYSQAIMESPKQNTADGTAWQIARCLLRCTGCNTPAAKWRSSTLRRSLLTATCRSSYLEIEAQGDALDNVLFISI